MFLSHAYIKHLDSVSDLHEARRKPKKQHCISTMEAVLLSKSHKTGYPQVTIEFEVTVIASALHPVKR